MRSVRRARVACDPGCYPVRARNRDAGSLKIGLSGLPRAFGSSWAIRERRRRCAPQCQATPLCTHRNDHPMFETAAPNSAAYLSNFS